jgi:ankyrin repeat protein
MGNRIRTVLFTSPKDGEPPLHRAARVGDQAAIRSLVADGAAVDDVFDIRLDPSANEQMATPLMVAVGSADGASVETVELLLELGASPHRGLKYAAGLGWHYPQGGDAARVATLLRHGCDPNADGALSAVAGTGDAARLRLLLDGGATVETEPGTGFESPIHRAAASGSLECVQLLLERGAEPDPIPLADEWGFSHDTPVLTVAASAEIFSTLLVAGARAEAGLPHNRTILREVAENKRVSVAERIAMVRLLQAAGVDVNADPGGGGTSLGRVAMKGDDQAVEVLLAVGTDPRLGHNPLAFACFTFSADRNPNMERTIELLVGAGIDKDGADAHGFRPIHAAVSDDRYGPGFASSDGIGVAAIAALIDLGADVDAPFPDNGWRPIHTAAAQGRTAAVQLFLDAGIDSVGATADGATALDLARDAVVTYSKPVPRDPAAEERLMDRFRMTPGLGGAEERMVAIREAMRDSHSKRLSDARACVAFLESI